MESKRLRSVKQLRVVSALIAVALFIGPTAALAESMSSLQQQMNAKSQEAAALKAQVDTQAHAAATLEEQLEQMTRQMSAIKVRIRDTNAKVAVVNAELAVVNARMAEKRSVLNEYIKTDYYVADTSTLEVLVGSDSISDFLDKRQYIEASQDRINELLAAIEAVKAELDAKKAELDKLNESLALQRAELDAQAAAKNQLLEQTRGEQARYEALLKENNEARQRLANTIAKLYSNGPLPSKGYVTRGTVIGREGSTGFSTGSHLHWSVYLNGAHTNPANYVNNGRMSWPEANFQISQGYGPANWQNANYTFHDGIDMYAGFGAPIMATCDGNIIMDSFQPGGFGHYKVIDCGGGVWSLFGHMQ